MENEQNVQIPPAQTVMILTGTAEAVVTRADGSVKED